MLFDSSTLLVVCILIFATWLLRRRSSDAAAVFAQVPGPAPESLFSGSYGFLLNQPALRTTRRWTQTYGPTLRFRGLLGANRLCTSDPVALQHLMNVIVYRTPKTNVSRNRIARVLSVGLAWAEGDTHKRQRRIMTPSFIAPRIHELHEYFVLGATKLVDKWAKDLEKRTSMTINVVDDLSRTTLDVLGQGAFGLDLHCLENPDREVIRIYRGFMNAAFSSLSAFSLILNEFTPVSWSNAVLHAPSKRQRDLLHRNKVATQFAREIVQAKEQMLEKDDATAGNDILANFLRANRAERAKDQLAMDEIIAQVRTLVFAGHDTTTQSTAFALFLLALHPTFQQQVREEAQQLINANADADAFESAPLLNAAIKESMRLKPVAPTFARITTQDELIPLSRSLKLKDGTEVDRLPVPKGTEVLGSLSDFHIAKEVWGDDAESYRPERFLRKEGPTVDGKLVPGSYGGLLTFLTGPRTCLGWRFAVAEMQVVIAHLLASFSFEAVVTEKDLHLVNSPIVFAMVDGKAQVPLKVSPVSS